MIIGVTGHRFLDIQVPSEFWRSVCQNTEKLFYQHNPEFVITGMALGYDQWVAHICIKNNIKYIAAIPFIGQEKLWRASDIIRYNNLLEKAYDKIVVCDGEYAAWKLMKRNEYIVNNCNLLISAYNGQGTGGTAACVKYANKIGRTIINVL